MYTILSIYRKELIFTYSTNQYKSTHVLNFNFELFFQTISINKYFV